MSALYRLDDSTTFGDLVEAHAADCPWCDCPYFRLTSRGLYCPSCAWCAADPDEAAR